jgi:hypothetical protein
MAQSWFCVKCIITHFSKVRAVLSGVRLARKLVAIEAVAVEYMSWKAKTLNPGLYFGLLLKVREGVCMHIERRMIFPLLLVSLLFPATAIPSSLTVVNADFSAPPIPCNLDYAYQGPGNCSTTTSGDLPFPQQNLNGASGVGWTFGSAGDGLTGPATPFNPPSFSGLPFTQAAFLQGSGSDVSQSVPGFTAGGSYVLDFYLGSRFNTITDGNQTVEALIDGSAIGTFPLISSTPFTLESLPFTASVTGAETLKFEGLAPGDHTAFVSDVSISSVPEPAYLPLSLIGFLALCALTRRKQPV